MISEQNITILIVEDSPTQREMLRYMLEKHDYRVEVAANGQEALKLLEQLRPIAVITDVNMPEMDGYELCRRIKGDEGLRNIPVLLLTSLSDPENVIMGLECGADYFIMKPYNEEFILSRIQHILANRTLENEEGVRMGLEIFFRGEKYFINSDRLQILNLLLSTYETAAQKNQDLADTTDKLSALNEKMEEKMAELEIKNRQLHDVNVELEKQREMAHLAKRQAEEANHAKSDFLSGMSHELRSPLNAILGFAQLMETATPPPTTAQQGRITQILQAGWHLLTLINEILDLAKVESGQMQLLDEPVPLADVMLECRSMIEQQAHQRGIRILFPLACTPAFVMADRTRVKQVLLNLLSNAIKYNSNEGTVEVECTESRPGHIRLSVRDTGAGLAPQQLEQLFQPFNRLSQEAGSEEGTGIGLVVAKRLVELMGGVIGVESTVGVGSVFWFELVSAAEAPAATEEKVEAEPDQPLVPCGKRLHTVLYVEDNAANMELVKQIIKRHMNIRLLTALDGNSGVEIARASRPDVILMDINLPDISGIEALKILRSEPATAHIPVVAVSANAMARDIERGVDEGFFSYITKPIKINVLMDALNVALECAAKQKDPASAENSPGALEVKTSHDNRA
ncbi:MAG: response regulator [Desulfuromonadaceae bacterium]